MPNMYLSGLMYFLSLCRLGWLVSTPLPLTTTPCATSIAGYDSLSQNMQTPLNTPLKALTGRTHAIHHTNMADPELWSLYFRLFEIPEDSKAQEAYARLDVSARERYRHQYRTALESDCGRLRQYQSLFHPDSRRSKRHKPYTPHRPAFQKDPYVLAYQYKQFMDDCDRRRCAGPEWRERANPYYTNLLANQDEPPEDATDDTSRAIRYAKEHHECFYDKSQVPMIISILDKQETSMQPSLNSQECARTYLHKTVLAPKVAKEHVARDN